MIQSNRLQSLEVNTFIGRVLRSWIQLETTLIRGSNNWSNKCRIANKDLLLEVFPSGLEVLSIPVGGPEVTADTLAPEAELLELGSSVTVTFFFFSTLLRCQKGPGQSALQSAYHDPHLDVTELKQDRTT